MATNTSTPSKTVAVSLFTPQQIASNAVGTSSTLSVSTAYAVFVGIHFGHDNTSGLTSGMDVRIEAALTTNSNQWFPVAAFKSGITAPGSQAVNGAVAAGTNVITLATTTQFSIGDKVLIKDSTVGNSEWGTIKSISAATSITLIDNLLNAATGGTVYNQAEFYTAVLDCLAYNQLRVVFDGKGTGQTTFCEANAITADSIKTS